MKRFLLLIVGLALGVMAGAIWFYRSLPNWAETPQTLPQAQIIHLVKGQHLTEFATHLQEAGFIDQAMRFRYWVKFYGDYSRFQAGSYRFEGAISPRRIVEEIEAGRIWQPIEVQYVIPEGFTLKQLIDRLVANKIGSKSQLQAASKKPELLEKYHIKGAKDLEGYLFPATYSFIKVPSPEAALEKMLQTFFAQLPAGIAEALAQRKLSLHQGIIFASLIERETQLDEELGMVSEVIWNRLKTGEPLGIDAALIYGIENYQGDIKTEHLRDAKNPYNTRIHKGLPPGPIGSISMASLKAVLNPTQFGYHFYCLGTDGSKYHHFSKTLAEHNVYVKQLIQAYKKP